MGNGEAFHPPPDSCILYVHMKASDWDLNVRLENGILRSLVKNAQEKTVLGPCLVAGEV